MTVKTTKAKASVAKVSKPVEPETVAEPVAIEPAVVEAVAAPVVEDVINEAEEALSPVADAPAPVTEQKDVFIMTTAFDAPKIFEEFNDRAKVAVEKSGKMLQEAADFSKGNVEAMVESTRIAAKGFETLGQNAADYSRKSFEGMTATLKSLSTVKSPTEFFQLQSDYFRSAFDSLVAEASKGTETMIKLAGDAAKPLSNRVAIAAEKVKVAA